MYLAVPSGCRKIRCHIANYGLKPRNMGVIHLKRRSSIFANCKFRKETHVVRRLHDSVVQALRDAGYSHDELNLCLRRRGSGSKYGRSRIEVRFNNGGVQSVCQMLRKRQDERMEERIRLISTYRYEVNVCCIGVIYFVCATGSIYGIGELL